MQFATFCQHIHPVTTMDLPGTWWDMLHPIQSCSGGMEKIYERMVVKRKEKQKKKKKERKRKERRIGRNGWRSAMKREYLGAGKVLSQEKTVDDVSTSSMFQNCNAHISVVPFVSWRGTKHGRVILAWCARYKRREYTQ